MKFHLAIAYIVLYYKMYLRLGRKGVDAMKRAKRQRLIPLTVMIAPDDIEWIKAQTYGTGDSMGRVIRQLINANRELQEAISKAKGEKE